MKVSVAEAEGQLADLVRRAETGDEVILTRQGRAAVRLVPVGAPQTVAERERIIMAVREAGRDPGTVGRPKPGFPLRRRESATVIVVDTPR